jgi:hypothetical protein
MYCIESVYTFLYSTHTVLYNTCIYIYLFICNAVKGKRLTSIIFGMVHSDRTVVALFLHGNMMMYKNIGVPACTANCMAVKFYFLSL